MARMNGGMGTKMKKTAFAILGVAAAFALSGGPALAGDADAGANVFKKKCKTCHTLEEGKHKTGPSLLGIVGRKAGTTDFKRYKGLKEADWTWDEALLDEYIMDPKKFVKARGAKSTSMTFKLKKDEDRADVIEFLKTQK